MTIAGTTSVLSPAQSAQVSIPISGYPQVSLAASYAEAKSTVETSLLGATSIVAAGDVDVSATGGVTATTGSSAAANTQGTTADNAYSLSLAIGNIGLTDTVTVANQASIVSGGNVNILATGTTSASEYAYTSDVSTTASAAVSVTYVVANVNVTMDGHVSAAGRVVTQNSLNAGDPTSVNLTTATFHLPNHGLTGGTAYTVHVISPDSFQLDDPTTGNPVALADPGAASLQAFSYVSEQIAFNPSTAVNAQTAEITLPGNDLQTGQSVIYTVDPTKSVTQTVQSQTTRVFSVDAIDATTGTLTLLAHGLATGDTVVYDDGAANGIGSGAISGLSSGASDTVRVVDADHIQFVDASGKVIPIAQGTAVGTQTFDDTTNGTVQSVTMALLDPAANTIALTGHGFTDGDLATFAQAAGAAVGGLTANASYEVHVLSADTFQLFDPATGAVVALVPPTGFGVGGLTAADATGTTITTPDQAVGGLANNRVYYVIKVDADHIRLVGAADLVAAAQPVALSSPGTGTQSFATTSLGSGINIAATLADTVGTSAGPSVASSQPAQFADIPGQVKSLAASAKAAAASSGRPAALTSMPSRPSRASRSRRPARRARRWRSPAAGWATGSAATPSRRSRPPRRKPPPSAAAAL